MKKVLVFLLLMSITTAVIAEPYEADTQCTKPIAQTVIGFCLAGIGTSGLILGLMMIESSNNEAFGTFFGIVFMAGGIGMSSAGGIMLSVAYKNWHIYTRCLEKKKQGYRFSPGITVSIDF